MRLKSKICAGMNWLLGDWWKPVYDGESWGICHRWRPYRREYGMTKKGAKHECNLRNFKKC
jgi:hypothetical protein